MSVPSAIIGIMVGAKPELKSAGYTQAVTSVLSFGLSLAGVSLVPTIQPTVSKRIAGNDVKTNFVVTPSANRINTNYVLTPSDNRILA